MTLCCERYDGHTNEMGDRSGMEWGDRSLPALAAHNASSRGTLGLNHAVEVIGRPVPEFLCAFGGISPIDLTLPPAYDSSKKLALTSQ
jgi:hypothetical protein